MRDQDAIDKFRVDIEAGWQQVEEGKVSHFDPEAVKRRGREKLAALRAAIREGLSSGPAELLDMEAIIAGARADYRRHNSATLPKESGGSNSEPGT